ncbi:hypothetical protein [Rhodopirellula bahusiensis]|nr:hypothetical protein [Rhodopirellula bahusiensis]
MKTKRMEIEICGDETTRHCRRLCIEVPAEMSNDEIELIDAEIFNDVAETTEWEAEESDGICADGHLYLVGPAKTDAEVELTISLDDLNRLGLNVTN